MRRHATGREVDNMEMGVQRGGRGVANGVQAEIVGLGRRETLACTTHHLPKKYKLPIFHNYDRIKM